jgi:hypothetical protein
MSDLRRKDEKRSAKRIANRKSACTSRARKKALVEEMTKTNAKLRRQALILSLLPDLVIAMTIDGIITFCSAPVERVLQHPIDDMVGANLADLILPSSRESLRKLVHHLVAAEEEAAASQGLSAHGKKRKSADDMNEAQSLEENGNQSSGSGSGADLSSGGAAVPVVSDKSFPLAVVQVESQHHQLQPELTNVVKNRKPSSSNSADSNALTRSLTSSSVGDSHHSGEDDGVQGGLPPPPDKSDDDPSKSEAANMSHQRDSLEQNGSSSHRTNNSSDDSYSSSSAAKRLWQANANLERNVRWHKETLLSGSVQSNSGRRHHKDDVTGASVTANNATARLSSLQHYPTESKAAALFSSSLSNANMIGKQQQPSSRYESMEEQSSSEDSLLAGVEERKKEGNNNNKHESSDDSGYRESNGSLPSCEDTSSSDNEMPNKSSGRVDFVRNTKSTRKCTLG